MLEKILTNIGLTKKEAQIYLAILEVGTNPISKIAAKAKINRVTTYDIVEKLTKRGLVQNFTKAKVKYFTATDPQIMVADFTKKAAELEKALPDLASLHKDTVLSKVRYFEGAENIKTIFTETLNSKTEILHFRNSETAKKIRSPWPNFEQEYTEKLAQQQITMRTIMPENDDIVEKTSSNDEENIRFCSKELYNFSSEIYIYEQKVAIISYNPETTIGIVMENQEIAATHRALFNMIWTFCNIQKATPLLADPNVIARKSGNIKIRQAAKETISITREDQIQLF